MSLFSKDTPMRSDYVTCERSGDELGVAEEYCLDVLAAGTSTFDETCGPCMTTVIFNLDIAAGQELPWAARYRKVAGLDKSKRLRAIKRAGINPKAEAPGPNLVEEES